VIGKIKALIQERIDIRGPVLAGTLPILRSLGLSSQYSNHPASARFFSSVKGE
jgi:hypothetical protein